MSERRATWLIGVFVVVLCLLGAGQFYLRGQESEQARRAEQLALQTRQLAERTRQLALQNRRLTLGIQKSRVAVCKKDNDRHDKLEGLLAQARKRAKTKTQRAQIDLFVNVIAQKRDCSALAPRR